MNKKQLSERDICTKFITPALRQAGWNEMTQLREEVSFTKGRIIVRGKMVRRGEAKRADYILYNKPNIPLTVIEAKDNNCSVGDGLQQALEYGEALKIPFVFSSNGDGLVFHDGGPEVINSMTKPIRVEHLQPVADWWERRGAEGSRRDRVAWRVAADEVKARGYNLDIKNPHTVATDHGDRRSCLRSSMRPSGRSLSLQV